MKRPAIVLVALVAAPVTAQEPTAVALEVGALMREALEVQADLPVEMPRLPAEIERRPDRAPVPEDPRERGPDEAQQARRAALEGAAGEAAAAAVEALARDLESLPAAAESALRLDAASEAAIELAREAETRGEIPPLPILPPLPVPEVPDGGALPSGQP
jgi:hypothetical protein